MALASEHQVASPPIRDQIEMERIWAGNHINQLVSEGMAPDEACRITIDQLEVADSDESVGTLEFLEWVFVDDFTEFRRWCGLTHVREPYEGEDWRIEGF